MAHFVFLFFKNTQKISHNKYIRIIHGGGFNVDVKKYLLISINATHSTGNPYKDIEIDGWQAKVINYTYFSTTGTQIGRMKSIQLQRGQSIPDELMADIMSDNVIKLTFGAYDRIYFSKLADYSGHDYPNCRSWIDIQIIARLNGFSADSVTQLAKTLGAYESNRFSMLIKCVKLLTAKECINLTQLTGYFATQKINDQGVVINTAILKVCMELIDSYNKAIHDFEVTTKYPVNNKSIVQDFYEKYGINQTDEIYTLLDNSFELSDLEVDLIYILKFINSKTVQLVKKIANCICGDGTLRGMINFFQNKETGFNRHIDLFDRGNKIISVNPKEVIRAIKNNKQIDIRQSPMIIKRLKALLPLLLSFNHEKIIIDLSKATEFTIAKITGCDWRIDAYKNGNLEVVLRKKWPSVNLPHVDVRKLDTQFAIGNYHTQLDEMQSNEWKECNKDIIITRGNLIYAAHRALKEKKQICFQGIILDQIDNDLLICLPTGRIIRIPVDYNKMEIKIIETGKRLTGSFLFGLICQCLQRDMLMHVVVDLAAQGYNIAYYTHDQIIIDDDKPLSPKMMCSPYVTIK